MIILQKVILYTPDIQNVLNMQNMQNVQSMQNMQNVLNMQNMQYLQIKTTNRNPLNQTCPTKPNAYQT